MTRKLPALTPETSPFWQGGARGVLQIYFCSACGRFFHPPNPMCPNCGSFDVAPRAVSGRGRVVTFTVNRQAWTAELTQPYVVAIVELEEQADLRLLSVWSVRKFVAKGWRETFRVCPCSLTRFKIISFSI